TEGYYKKNRERMIYGLKIGVMLGCIGGVLSGVIAQNVFSFILGKAQEQSLFYIMFARTIGWAVFGALLGISYGVKQNTLGDLKFGAMSGFIGGTFAGILFDPIGLILNIGNGIVSRAVGFAVLGAFLGAAIKSFQEYALRIDNRDMYRTLTYRLPENLRIGKK
ncbi:hypothetical protein ACFL6D_05080, partial [Spirochaetota bacterium]